VVLIVIIGLRYRVGPDWDAYRTHMDGVSASSWVEASMTKDPAYWLLNWFANTIGAEVWLINIVCAIIYVVCLFRLCETTLNPWLGIAVAMPFMGIVVGMNYTRQSAALGFVLLSIVALQRNQVLRFAVLGVVGALFHATAIIVLPLGALAATRRRVWRWAWICVASALAYVALLESSIESLSENYLGGQMLSGGTVVRVLMNGFAAICIFIVAGNRQISPFVQKLWRGYALSFVPFLGAIIFLPPLTVIDRLALYWMPLQLYGFANLPEIVKKLELKGIASVAILVCYAAVQFIWFTYGNFSYYWKPYRFYPWEFLLGRSGS